MSNHQGAVAPDLVERLVARHGARRDALLPILHDMMEEAGHIPEGAIASIAGALNISRADVHGVIGFYPDFRTHAHGRHTVKLCRAESCQARGGQAVEAAMANALGTAMDSTRADGQVTLEAIYCLGMCAIGPNALVDGRPVARIDAQAVSRIAQQVAA